MDDPVTTLLKVLFLFALPVAVLMWAARERGQTRWFGVFGVLSLVGLLVGMLIIDRRPRPADRHR
jgi:hypothetical protein